MFFDQACKAEAIDTSGLTPAQGTWEWQQEKLEMVCVPFRSAYSFIGNIRSFVVLLLFIWKVVIIKTSLKV